ncbi:MAG: hypothetical protein IT423_04565 [Pirellulaceae bacterium]|nr:hypothetical protein [Pirellulaceae bacterium]
MGALEGFLKQIRDLFNTMTPSARIMAALMTGVVVVSLGWIVSTQQSGRGEYLLGGQSFTDEQLNKMESALGEAGLSKYERIGARLKIPTADKGEYLKALAEKKAFPSGQWNDEVMSALQGNPLDSPNVLAARVKQGKLNALSRALESITGISRAQVSHEVQQARFGRDSQQSAAVFLEGVNKEPISQDVLRQISKQVTKHFPGLRAEDVTVMDIGNGYTYQPTGDPMESEQQLFLQAQRQWEQHYKDKVAPELQIYGDVKLGVIVELDPILKREMEQLKYDPVGSTTKQSNQRKDTKSAKAAPGGRPGADPNGAGGANRSQSLSVQADQTAESKESQEELESVVGRSATVTKEAGLTPKRVSFTVGIPETYYDLVHIQRELAKDKTVKDPPPLDEAGRTKLKKEIEDNIRAAIEGQLPQVRQGDDRFQLVKVYSYTPLPVPEPEKPSFAETALAWLNKSWQTIGLFVLVGMTLLMTFSWIKSQSSPESDRQFAQGFGLEVPESMGDSLELGDEAVTQSEQEEEDSKKFQITGGEIKEELSSLIKQNPDAAVNLLRSWIGEAA